ncbi:helix-turn-helix domain-containing protein [Synechococcus sp. PCC 7336]|uniref:helix-turn-helix domain-containing protein n=1 Tax=Synechococcus sp. PCC 7336 TaxID=195250 RepID=UPI00036A8E1C
MHREDIKAALRKAGYTLSEIAREFDVTPTTVSKIVKGSCRSRRIEAAIAEKLQVPIEEVFPEKYADLHKSRSFPCRS